ncbi:hypothetical protein PENSPDRAFT_432737 [Peniophora sp. CONT]|nr:hypothetical protein PENSPDRAFT_432737 [Peniophora sp. CONT]
MCHALQVVQVVIVLPDLLHLAQKRATKNPSEHSRVELTNMEVFLIDRVIRWFRQLYGLRTYGCIPTSLQLDAIILRTLAPLVERSAHATRWHRQSLHQAHATSARSRQRDIRQWIRPSSPSLKSAWDEVLRLNVMLRIRPLRLAWPSTIGTQVRR